MKSLKLWSRLFAAFGLMMMFAVSGWGVAATLPNTDTFTGSTNSWSNGTNVTSNTKLQINRDETGSKTYDFGVTHANQQVTINFDYLLDGGWESSGSAQDTLNVTANGVVTIFRAGDGNTDPVSGSITTITATLNGTGQLILSVNPDTTSNGENIRIDNVTIASAAQIPPVMADVPDQTANIGSAFSLNLSTYVTLTNGDPISIYTLSGTLPAGLSFNTTTGVISGSPTITGNFNLSITATDNDGASNADSFAIVVFPAQTESTGGRDFILRQQENLFGDVKVIGNTVLCLHDTNGQCTESPTGTSNNNVDLQKTAVSSSTLTIPSGSTVKYARLYWQGRQGANSDTTWSSTQKTSAKEIWIKKEVSGTWGKITADLADFDYTSSGSNVRIYSASALVTDMITGSGTYYIDPSRFYTSTGATSSASTSDGLGSYGAWTLVVVYEDPNGVTARNVSIFDGYKKVVSGTNVDVNVSGFLTPKSGLVDSRTQVFTGEGDKYLANTGDVIKMAGLTYNTTFQTLGTFDSRIDVPGVREPSLTNNNGIDIHEYNTGTTSGGKNIITTNEVGAKFRFTSDQDTYFPSLIVFSTQLYLPQLCYDYSIKQDGRYLSVDRASYPIAQLDATISTSPLEIMVYLKNKDADFAAQGIAFKSDINESRFDFVGEIATSNTNGSALINRGTPTSTDPLCSYDKDGNNALTNNGCTNGHDIRKGLGSLGNQEYIYAQYNLLPQGISGIVGDINESLGLSLKYYITAGGNKIEYPDYVLGGPNVKLCPPTTVYQPAWGRFNVVQAGQPNNAIKNNIKTKLARKSFNVNVVFDSTPTTGDNAPPVSDVNTTVLVEMIDVDAFGDVNASCANPEAVNQAIFVPLNLNAATPQVSVEPQDAQYHNFALKNGAFRVWYFVDASGNLMPWKPVGLTDANKAITGITGTLFQTASHPLCNTSCGVGGGSASSTGCFTCMKQNYAKPVCSRDNFSIRPEAFDIRINDIDQTTHAQLNTLSDSTTYQYSPKYLAGVDRIRMAAGYDYGFNINATGASTGTENTDPLRDAVFAPVPRYTRIFAGADSDYNATMYWDPSVGKVTTGCNDAHNRSLMFYMINGSVVNQSDMHTNVGEYRINMVDQEWTAVDQETENANRTVARAFDITTDCQIGSNTVIEDLSGEYGCNVSSELTNGLLHYKDQKVVFRPYDLNIDTIQMTLGSDFNTANVNSSITTSVSNSTIVNGARWIYMNDLNQSDNMGVRYSGKIKAVGKDNIQLTNFVDNCYAEPLRFDGNLIFPAVYQFPTETRWEYRLQEINATTNQIWRDTNNTALNAVAPTNQQLNYNYLTLPSNAFVKTQNGVVDMRLTVNFDRNATTAMNPIVVDMNNLQFKCTPDTNCSTSAEGIMDYRPDSNLSSNVNMTFAYGRLYSKDVRVFGSIPFAVNGWYEVFNLPVFNGAALSLSRDRENTPWYINPAHVDTNHGDAVVARLQRNGGAAVANINGISNAGVEDFNFPAQNPLPYSAKAHVNTEPWLWFKANGLSYADPGLNVDGTVDLAITDADCLNHPCFNVTVMPSIGASGSAKSGYEDSKDSKASSSTGGWKSTIDYAPAIR